MPLDQGDCRDCGNHTGELYMLRNKLWRSLGLKPGDRFCIACLSKRLGRPFAASDFTRAPLCNRAIRGVLAANEAWSETGAIEPTLPHAASRRK
jgi:hypothetical protein